MNTHTHTHTGLFCIYVYQHSLMTTCRPASVLILIYDVKCLSICNPYRQEYREALFKLWRKKCTVFGYFIDSAIGEDFYVTLLPQLLLHPPSTPPSFVCLLHTPRKLVSGSKRIWIDCPIFVPPPRFVKTILMARLLLLFTFTPTEVQYVRQQRSFTRGCIPHLCVNAVLLHWI